jgi:hypothetical protein
VPKSHPHKKLYACRCQSKSLPPSRMRLCMRYCRAGTRLRAALEHSHRYTPNYLRKFAAVCLEPPADSDLEDVLAEGAYRRTGTAVGHTCYRPL